MQSVASPLLLIALFLGSRGVLAAEPEGNALRGAAVFQKYCVLCHGASGHGDGRAAALQKARPADLTLSDRSDAYKLQIIREGGVALQRSTSMPPWSDVLSESQIRDVVAYLRTLTRTLPATAARTTQPSSAR
jgi:cytochrome c oxidase cbb3-type subunit III